MQICERLKEARKNIGMTQEAAPWVFYGIGLAGVMTYFATMEKNEADSKELEQ